MLRVLGQNATGVFRCEGGITFCQKLCSYDTRKFIHMAEQSKIREYAARIRQVEHADFNPLVFTCTGGLAPQSHLVLKRLADTLSKKQNIPTSVVSGWLRCKLNFALLRTTLLCVRATRRKRYICDNNIELAAKVTRLET